MRVIKQFWQERDGRMLDYLLLLAVVGVIAAYIMPSLRQESACIHEGAMTNVTKSISKADPRTGECQTTFEGDLIADGTPPSPPPSGGGGTTPPPPVDTSTDATVALPTEKDANGCFVLRTVGQLQAMKTKLQACYVLGNDIDASGTSSWNGGAGFEPVGNSSTTPFEGWFDGKNHQIRGLVINRPSKQYVGLFGNVDTAWGSVGISNVTLVDFKINGLSEVGALAGGDHPNALTNIRVKNVQLTGGSSVGGIIGKHRIYACNECHVEGFVKGGRNVGGVVGLSEGATYVRTSFKGEVEVTANDALGGGLIGSGRSNTIKESFSSGKVTGMKLRPIIGGLIGRGYNTTSISNSYTISDKVVFQDYEVMDYPTVGGLMGENNSTLSFSNVYSSGTVGLDYDEPMIGGLIGHSTNVCTDLTVSSGFWDTTTAEVFYTECNKGTGKPTAQMKTQSTYAGWDFTNVWAINPSINNGYPYLRNNPPN